MAPTAHYIAHHAALRPSDLAVVDRNREIAFAEFSEDLRRFTAALENLDLAQGQTVAVEWTALYDHLLFVLALESLGVATFSYTQNSVGTNVRFLRTVDLVVCTERFVPKNAKRALVLSAEQRAGLFNHPPLDEHPGEPLKADAPVRIHHTSGTIGTAKRIVRTAKVNEFRIQQYQAKEGYNRYARFLVSRSFSIQALYGRALACLRMGGACVGGSDDVYACIPDRGITHMSVLPADLAKIVKSLPRDFAKPDRLTLATFGGRVPYSLRAQTLRDFATELIESYGTNEVGSICTIGPDGVGQVLPGVTVEVVDEDDRPLIGQEGRVRVLSAGCIAAYDDDRNATGRMFRDGWFYPGDRGVMPGARSLKLLGRDDDLINIGGLKVDCAEFEEHLRRALSPEDLCVTSVLNRDGVEKLCVALVLDPTADFESIKEKIAPIFSPNLGEILLVKLDALPKTETGKVRREDLRKLLGSINETPNE